MSHSQSLAESPPMRSVSLSFSCDTCEHLKYYKRCWKKCTVTGDMFLADECDVENCICSNWMPRKGFYSSEDFNWLCMFLARLSMFCPAEEENSNV